MDHACIEFWSFVQRTAVLSSQLTIIHHSAICHHGTSVINMERTPTTVPTYDTPTCCTIPCMAKSHIKERSHRDSHHLFEVHEEDFREVGEKRFRVKPRK